MLEALAQRPERIPASFITQIIDQVQVSNLIIPAGQIVGLNQATVTVYDRSPAAVDVVNTTTETSIYSKLIAAGQMSSDKMLRLTIHGDYLHNNVAGDQLTFRVKFGGATHVAFSFGGSFGNVTGSTRQAWKATVEVNNLGATNSQTVSVVAHAVRANQAPPAAGVGGVYDSINTGGAIGAAGITTLGSIDTGQQQTLEVTAQWDTASTNNSFNKRIATLELI